MSERHLTLRLWPVAPLAVVALCASMLLPARAQQAADEARPLSAAERRVVEALRATRAKPPPAVDATRELVVRDARDAVELFVVMLDERRVPGIDALAVQRLSVLQDELIRDGLRSAGREPSLRAVQDRLAGSNAASTRAAAIEVFGLFGQAADLRAIVGLTEIPDRTDLDPAIDAVLAEALTAVLVRDPAGFEALRSLAQSRTHDVLSAMVFAVGAARDERGLAFLSDVLKWRDDLEIEALSQVRLIGRSSSGELDRSLAQIARESLDPTKESRCRAAALALGTLEDPLAVPRLIEMLESDSNGMREDALWSLRRISKLDFPAEPKPWERWHAAEQRWYEQQFPARLKDLRNDDRSVFAGAVQALSAHALYRHEIAEALVATLDRVGAELRRIVCTVLGDLRSNVAVPALKRALEDPDPRVVECARAALAAITGVAPKHAEANH